MIECIANLCALPAATASQLCTSRVRQSSRFPTWIPSRPQASLVPSKTTSLTPPHAAASTLTECFFPSTPPPSITR